MAVSNEHPPSVKIQDDKLRKNEPASKRSGPAEDTVVKPELMDIILTAQIGPMRLADLSTSSENDVETINCVSHDADTLTNQH